MQELLIETIRTDDGVQSRAAINAEYVAELADMLKAGRKLAAGSGAFVLSGADATLTYSGSAGPTYTLSAGAGTFSLTGAAASLKYGRRLVAGAGTFALTGAPVTLTYSGAPVLTKAKGLRKTRYIPGRVPTGIGERFLQSELERINDGLESPHTHATLEELYQEPSRKPKNAVMLCMADGTDWNPGSGRGLYLYDPDSATWTKVV